ncbi:MAG: SRPBCC family protein [Thermoanaerobaculia bacterium]
MFTPVLRDFVVKASLHAVWEHLSNVERWPTWARHIKRVVVSPAGQLGPASSGSIVLRNGIRSTFQMVEFNPYVNWKWVGPLLWMQVCYDHRFEPTPDGGTHLSWRVDLTGTGAKFAGRLFGAIYNRNLDIAIPLFAAEVDQPLSP